MYRKPTKKRLYDNAKLFPSTGIGYLVPIKVKAKKHTKKSSIKQAISGNLRLFNYDSITSRSSGYLTTESFKSALSQFIERIVRVKIEISDNGSNFIGEESEIRAFVKKHLDCKNITWKFN